MFDLIREILQTLRHNKLRTALTGFAVVWGVFLLIILLGVSQGVYNSFSKNAMSHGSRISIYNGYTSLPYKGLKENRLINMRDADMGAITHENSGFIETASAEVYLSGVVSTNNDYVSNSINGVYPDYAVNMDINIIAGRFINDKDMQSCRKVIVMSRTNAEILFGSADKAVGERVKFNGLSFLVVGLYDKQGYSSFYMPFSTAMQLKGRDGKIASITLLTKNIQDVEQAQDLEKDVKSTLSRRHQFSPEDPSAVWIWNQYVQQMMMLGGLDILDIAIWIIGILTLLTGVVGVSNIMFVSVRERTHEIGIRRAIGAKPGNILRQIIAESVAITALFGYIGILCGICVTELLSVLMTDVEVMDSPTVSISVAASVTIVLVLSGCISGIFPAIKALKIKPVEALRAE